MSSTRTARFLKLSLFLLPLGLLPATSCQDDGGGGGGANPIQSALIACGLATSGIFGGPAADDAFGHCMTECISTGSCAELQDLYCDFGPTGEAFVDACAEQCLQAHGHACDDTMISPYAVCDGFEDCADGSDEVGCAPGFICGDGSEIPSIWQCDGFEDCTDGSDEAGCNSQLFTCGDGSQVPLQWQCDQEPDCPDGSDEAGCAMLTCP